MIFPNPHLLGLGAVGVAIAVFSSNVFMGILNRVFAKRKCPVIALGKSVKFIALGILTFVAFYFSYNYLEIFHGTSGKIIFVITYFGVFYLVLSLFRWMNVNDLRTLRELINLRKMTSYIRKEIKDK
jgi:hypothetical protein